MNILLAYTIIFGLMIVGSSPAGASINQAFVSKLSVEERVRYEYRSNYDLNESRKDNGGLIFNRLRLSAQTSWMVDDIEQAVFVLEGLDAQSWGHHIKALRTQKDTFDFHQGYVRFPNLWGRVTPTVGRQELAYGNNRLITKAAFSNLGMTVFDAAKLRYVDDGLYLDVFYAQAVKYDDHNFDRSSHDEWISGVYVGFNGAEKDQHTLEAYVLPQVNDRGNQTIKRYTVGGRWQGPVVEKVKGEMEFPYQFGSYGENTIEAYAFSVSLWRQVESWPGRPTFTVEYDQASGDKDPDDSVSNTFNPLYPSSHTPYGIIDFWRWQNMREVEFRSAFNLTKKLQVQPQTDFFWVENTNDAWYGASGSVLRNSTGAGAKHYVGQEVALLLTYNWSSHLKWEGGYAHFFSGPYAQQSGANDDANWIYTQLSIKY